MAYAVAGNPDDAADAVSDAFTRVFQALPTERVTASAAQFRPYLLAATRNAALDGLRRQGRTQPTHAVEDLDRSSTDLPAERALEVVDSSLVAVAFRSLPERWRSVLWLTEVEGIPAREAAPMLGITANGLAQLAVRARAGLRANFLQAHVRSPVARSCKFPVDKLGAYIAGGLSPRETAKVDQHLASCADCRQQVEELEDLGALLRRAVIPVPLALGAVSLSKWKLATHAASAVRRRAATAGLEGARKPILAVATAVLALGVLGAAVLREPDDGNRNQPNRTATAPTDGGPVVLERSTNAQGGGLSGVGQTAAGIAGTASTGITGTAAAPSPGGPGTDGDNGGGNGTPGDGDGGGDPPPVEAVVQGEVYLASSAVGLNLGVGENSCTGVQLTDLILGCTGAPSESLLTVRTGGQVPGDNEINL
jgi:RNA polymerase sigma factor (sigma-70 family)